jgi:CBS domain containing-hemolysin-like protein
MEPPIAGPSAGEIVIRLGITLLLVFANGFFVAAEFALVGARRTRVAALAEGGNSRAKVALHVIEHMDRYISGTQLGITLASLGLGWVAESTLSGLLMSAFDALPAPWNVVASHSVAGVIAFALITFLHIVFGELAPKSLALLFPEAVSLWTAAPLRAFSTLLALPIHVLNGSANLLLKLVGLQAPHEAERVHRPEEIEMLLTQTYEHGLLSEEPVEMIRGVFDLSETSVAQVMTPRTRVIGVEAGSSLEEAATRILESGHNRLPVFRDSIDHIEGVVLARDVWRAQREGRGDQPLRELLRPTPFIPETKSVEDLLRQMQAERVHMAVILDEYGGTAGIVTVEDLLEEIVGEIRDEHEQVLPEGESAEGEVLLPGSLSLADLNDRYDLRLPEREYLTVAGFVMGRLGRVARAGEVVEFPGGKLRVVAMSGRRIERLALYDLATE